MFPSHDGPWWGAKDFKHWLSTTLSTRSPPQVYGPIPSIDIGGSQSGHHRVVSKCFDSEFLWIPIPNTSKSALSSEVGLQRIQALTLQIHQSQHRSWGVASLYTLPHTYPRLPSVPIVLWTFFGAKHRSALFVPGEFLEMMDQHGRNSWWNIWNILSYLY